MDHICSATLVCSHCMSNYDITQVNTFCPNCIKPFLVEFDLPLCEPSKVIYQDEHSMWRYANVLPLMDQSNRVSLGEGMTPLSQMDILGKSHGLTNLWLKDEGLNPTGSFKARGLSMAVSKAKELGIKKCVIPTAGNAGGALSAYCAKAGIEAIVVMPNGTPRIFQMECELHGAKLTLVDGLIDACGKKAKEIKDETGAFNISTLKEPYRIEGKKTMGYEITEQMSWSLPDAIIYPTGGGTGLIGMWKAFNEMVRMGWVNSRYLPKMIVVQSELCAPMVDLFKGKKSARSFQMSIANGLSVPKAFGEDLIMSVLNESEGTALTVSDKQMVEGMHEFAQKEGIIVSPEGAAVWEATKQLVDLEFLHPDEKILMINTGSGFKYFENIDRDLLN
ncbi:threonine synthase [Fulvivirga sp. M361]|uniref:threonine synthase n=1 Tax=Fulvivirga sp. M361 TaxID=2594266 RepID=UPI001179957F|nr:threonine synthase [Fulvivirga sp. M361]TRX54875.1 threonine synthase [Fulvivirga sp. M361]